MERPLDLVVKNTFVHVHDEGSNSSGGIQRTQSCPGRLEGEVFTLAASTHLPKKAATEAMSATDPNSWLDDVNKEFDPLETIPESSIPSGHAVVDETPVQVQWPRTDSENEDGETSMPSANHCGKQFLINAVDVQAKEAIQQDHATLFENIFVECQNKITQKTFQLLKKPSGNAHTDEQTVLPENPGVESILAWNFSYTVELCNQSMYHPVLTFRLCEWANTLQWEVNATGETSFLELFLEYSFTTKTLAPCDTINPPYFYLYDACPTSDSSGFLLSHKYLNFGKAVRWLEKRFTIQILPPERKKHCSSLRTFGWRGAMWGVKRKVHLLHRDRINEFIKPLKIYRAKSLQVAFPNPHISNTGVLANDPRFVSPEVAYKKCFNKHYDSIHVGNS